MVVDRIHWLPAVLLVLAGVLFAASFVGAGLLARNPFELAAILLVGGLAACGLLALALWLVEKRS